jgi:hypothetical protein
MPVDMRDARAVSSPSLPSRTTAQVRLSSSMPNPNARCRPMPRVRLAAETLGSITSSTPSNTASGRRAAPRRLMAGSRRAGASPGRPVQITRGMPATDEGTKTERRHVGCNQPTPCGGQPIGKPGTIDHLTLRPGLVCHGERMMHEGVELPLARAVATLGADDRADACLEGKLAAGWKWQRQRLALDAIRWKNPIEVRWRKGQLLA